MSGHGFLRYLSLTIVLCFSETIAADETYGKTIDWLQMALPGELALAPFGKLHTRIAGSEIHTEFDGFLLEDRAESFVFYDCRGDTSTFPKESQRANRVHRFVPGDLDAWLDRLVLGEPSRKGRVHLRWHPTDDWPVRTAAIALYVNHARAGDARTGDDRKEDAGKGDARSEALRKHLVTMLGGAEGSEGLNRLRVSMGRLAAHELVQDFPDTSLSRKDLLARYERHRVIYPLETAAGHDDMIDRLKRMIAEDETHVAVGGEDLSQDEQIGLLIYQLRDQTGEQFSIPGLCDILGTWYYESTAESVAKRMTPANRLARLGNAAVPQLIDAMTDPTLTRAVGHKSKFTNTGRVLTVGECAGIILHHLSGEFFRQPADARRWWAELQTKGERQYLGDQVAAGGDRSPVHASKLVKLYPDAALEAIQRGVEAAQDFRKSSLLQVLRDLDDPKAEIYLREIASRDDVSELRMVALDLYRSRDLESARKIMMSVLDEKTLRSFPKERVGLCKPLARYMSTMARFRDPSALNRFQSLWGGLPINVKHELKSALDDTLRRPHKIDESWKSAVEELFVFMLADRSIVTGFRGSWGGVRFDDPRLCDMVGLSLAQYWDRYPFEYGKSPQERDLNIVRCRNVWLAERGAPLEPEPVVEKIKPLGQDKFRRCIAAFRGAKTETEADRELESLAKYGLAVTQPLASYLESKPEIPARRLKKLQNLLHTLSWTVERVAVSQSTQQLWSRSTEWADPKKWMPIEGSVYELAAEFCLDTTGATRRLEIRVQRAGDLTGATVSIEARPSDGESTRCTLQVEGTTRRSSQSFRPERSDERAKAAIRDAFSAPANQEAKVRLILTRGAPR